MENFFNNFRKQKFKDRTSVVKLKNFGDTTDVLEWHIRGLNATDLELIDAEVDRNNAVSDLVEAALKAAGGDSKSKSDVAKEMFGMSDKVPGSLIRKYVVFELGSIEPNRPEDRQDTIKFANAYPVEFRNIVNHIFQLTGLGQMAKKKQLQDIANSETT